MAGDLCSLCLDLADSPQPFPLSRSRWSFASLLDYSVQRFRREWLMLSISALLVLVIAMAGSVVQIIPQLVAERLGSPRAVVVVGVVGYVINFAFQGIVSLGMSRIALDVLQGQPADPVRVFSQLRKIGRYLIQGLILITFASLFAGAYLAIALVVAVVRSGEPTLDALFSAPSGWEAATPFLIAGAIAIVPAFYLFTPFYFVPVELALGERIGAVGAIRNCFAVLRGERLSAIGVLIMTGVVTFIGVLACCVGFVPAFGLATLLYAGVYLALRGGAALPIPD
jgi:hypothetical protein